MGYSIAIRARNQTLRKKMVKFMAANHRKWSDVIGEGKSISSRPGLGADGELDYDHNKLAVGFDYASHCHGWESALIYSETRWMALKIGQTKTRFKDPDKRDKYVFEEPKPFMVYDGYDEWPILVVKNLKEALKLPEKQRWCAFDKFGVYIGPEANEILISFCEGWAHDVKKSEKMSLDLAKLGKRPSSNVDPAGDAAFMVKWRAIKIKHMRPEIDEMLPKVRAEVARLDKLWEASA
jgi:hypothetical protein